MIITGPSPRNYAVGSANCELYQAVQTWKTLRCGITAPICQLNWTWLGEGGCWWSHHFERMGYISIRMILFCIALAWLHCLLNKWICREWTRNALNDLCCHRDSMMWLVFGNSCCSLLLFILSHQTMPICKWDLAADFQNYIKNRCFFLSFSNAPWLALPLQGRLTLLFAFVSI